jgi:hypothetical protein
VRSCRVEIEDDVVDVEVMSHDGYPQTNGRLPAPACPSARREARPTNRSKHIPRSPAVTQVTARKTGRRGHDLTCGKGPKRVPRVRCGTRAAKAVRARSSSRLQRYGLLVAKTKSW